MGANLTIVLIFGLMLAAACYAIKHLKSTPARVVGVLAALAALIGAMKPIVQLIKEEPSPRTSVVAPATSGPSGAAPPRRT
ncbi:hypothetical protein ACU639_01805 [Streptomyces cynarae]|uniref:hypothetical protein n=1 Tax=Streptomyces cynarae TaxID=2981134 RepID=UPI00406C6F55